MKEAWDKTTTILSEFQELLKDYGSTMTGPPSEFRKFNEVQKKWKEVIQGVNNFDTYVSPVEAIAVKLPEAGQEFCDLWKFWKEYLMEQHGVVMRSRSELKSLERLFELADNKPEEAIYFLNYAMSSRYKNFFKIDRKEATETKKVNRDSDY